MATTTLVEVDDPRWDELVGDDEPDAYGGRSYLAAVTAAAGTRAVLVAVEGAGWSARYPLVLRRLPGDRWLARTPDYGGPSIRLGEPTTGLTSPPSVVEAAQACRRAIDEELSARGVISEVFLLSPWLPDHEAIAVAWSARAGKPVCLICAGFQDRRWARLRKGRRSDITRARRELELTWGPLDEGAARRFAGHYGRAMQRVDAAERWRFEPEWFVNLVARAPGHVLSATAEGPTGGATALFLTGRTTAAYFLASRWGQASGAPSCALWTGIEELMRVGVKGITLGGGAGENKDDPVLAFKRSFADQEVPLLIGARVFDRQAHDEAVADGRARPLPDGAVAA